MSKSSREIHESFLASFGKQSVVALVRCAVRAHEVSRALVRHGGFAPNQARDVLPYIRRAEFETHALGILASGVRVESRKNRRGTSSFVELSTSDASLTALTRSMPPTRLPKALYRDTRAEESQITFEEIINPKSKGESKERLYGCFVYGGRQLELSLARVYFPLPGKRLLSIQPLDLLKEHAAVVEAEREAAAAIRPSEEAVEIAMTLKRKAEVSRP